MKSVFDYSDFDVIYFHLVLSHRFVQMTVECEAVSEWDFM